MRLARRHWIKAARRSAIPGEHSVPLQQVGQGEQTEPRAGFLQKVAAVGELFVASAVMVHGELLKADGLSAKCLALSSPGERVNDRVLPTSDLTGHFGQKYLQATESCV